MSYKALRYHGQFNDHQACQRGVTLTELMVVLAILAILLIIAIPRMDMLQSSRLDGAARVIWSDIHKAKMTAIKENRNIKIEFSGSGYDFIRVSDDETIYSRNVTEEYPGVSLTRSSSQPIVFTSKGVAVPPSQTIFINLGGQTKSFTVLSSGRIGGIS